MNVSVWFDETGMAEKAEKDGEQDGQKRQGEVGADAVQTKT